MTNKLDFVIDQGANFELSVSIDNVNDEPLNVSGFTAESKMRKYFGASNSFSFTTALSNGQMTITMTAVQTANISSGRYVYDTFLTDTNANTVYKILEGVVTVVPKVT